MVIVIGTRACNFQWLPAMWSTPGWHGWLNLKRMQSSYSVGYAIGPFGLSFSKSETVPPTHPNPAPLEAALFKAILARDAKAVQDLLEQGADVHARDEYGVPLLKYAIMSRNVQVVMMLFDAGADANARSEESGITALMWAASTGNADIVRLLLEQGADAHAREGLSTATALYWGFQGRKTNPKVIALLLQQGVDENGRKNISELLFHAARYGRTDIVKMFLAAGADPNVHGGDGSTALWWARKRRNKDLQRLLTAAGALSISPFSVGKRPPP